MQRKLVKFNRRYPTKVGGKLVFVRLYKWLIYRKKPFTASITSTTSIFKVPDLDTQYLQTPKYIPGLNKLAKMVQTDVDKREWTPVPYSQIAFNGWRGNKLNLWDFGGEPTKTFTNVVEIDADSFYFSVMREIGMISEETYQAGIEASKVARLVSAGKLATTKHLYSFDGETVRKTGTEFQPNRKAAYQTMCHRAGQIMEEIQQSCGQGSFMFWVDAIFVNTNKAPQVVAAFADHGIGCKIVPLKSITVEQTGVSRNVIKVVEESGRVKRFKRHEYNTLEEFKKISRL